MKKTITFLLRIVAIVLLLIVVIESAFSQSGLPSLYHPIAAYHYATPVLQVRSLNDISVRFVNLESNVLTNVVLKADVREPSGNVGSLSVVMDSTFGRGFNGAETDGLSLILLAYPSFTARSIPFGRKHPDA